MSTIYKEVAMRFAPVQMQAQLRDIQSAEDDLRLIQGKKRAMERAVRQHLFDTDPQTVEDFRHWPKERAVIMP